MSHLKRKASSLDTYFTFTQLIGQEDFILSRHHKSLQLYKIKPWSNHTTLSLSLISYMTYPCKRAHQYNVAGSDPLLSSTNWIRRDVSHTRIRVPLQEAVATIVPCWFTARHASSPWWALIVTGALDIPASVLAKSYVHVTALLPTDKLIISQRNSQSLHLKTKWRKYSAIILHCM